MAKYDVTYKCGHTGTIALFGKNDDRHRRLEWLRSCDCPDCLAARRNAAAEKKMDEDAGNGLPRLTGSEKQIAWAVQLRDEFVRKVDELRRRLTASYEQAVAARPEMQEKHTELHRNNMDTISRTLGAILANKTASSWWIENRSRDVLRVLQEEAQKSEKKVDAPAAGVPDDAEAKAEATVTPDPCSYAGAVELSCQDDRVSLRYVRNEDFRKVIRDMGYTWNRDRQAWERTISKFAGLPEDRAAEAANVLLRAGFAVTIYDDDLRRKAICADYALECHHWVMQRSSGKYAGWLAIRWPKGDQALYDVARKIHGSRWDSPDVVVPIEFWPEVLDFAECNAFQVSDGAREAIDKYEAAKCGPVSPAEAPAEPEREDVLRRILDSPDGVLPDLEDK